MASVAKWHPTAPLSTPSATLLTQLAGLLTCVVSKKIGGTKEGGGRPQGPPVPGSATDQRQTIKFSTEIWVVVKPTGHDPLSYKM